jgi:hypothetical protein
VPRVRDEDLELALCNRTVLGHPYPCPPTLL